MNRRREGDRDWSGAQQRKPWDGPTTKWGEDVNTRLGSLEIVVSEIKDDVSEMVVLFRRSKRFGFGILAVLAFLGWNGVIAVTDWIKQHIL